MKKLLVLVIILLILYIFRVDLLTAYARFFTVNTATKGADAIIVLSGNIDTRPRHAAKLFHEGYARQLFLTQERDYNGHISAYVKARNFYARKQLENLGVPVSMLPSLRPEGATSTFDEAYDLVAYLREHPMQHIILVTDAFHSRRVFYAFNKVFDLSGVDGVQLEVAAAPNGNFDETNWFTTEKGLLAYIMESLKLLFYLVSTENTTLVKAY